MLHKTLLIAAILALLTAGTPAFAQKTGPNGGMIGGTGGHQTELVVSPTALTVYLLEHGKPHGSKGVVLRAVVQEGGKTAAINFVDEDGKRLVAKLAAPLGTGAIVVLTGKDDHGDAFNARYVIK